VKYKKNKNYDLYDNDYIDTKEQLGNAGSYGEVFKMQSLKDPNHM
jgi:hypothetical protein